MIAGVSVITETEQSTDTSTMTTAMCFTLHANVDIVNRPRDRSVVHTSQRILTPTEPHNTINIQHTSSIKLPWFNNIKLVSLLGLNNILIGCVCRFYLVLQKTFT